MSEHSPLEYILRRDRMVVLTSLAGVTALAWVYLFLLAGDMSDKAKPNQADHAQSLCPKLSAGHGVTVSLAPWPQC